MRTRVLGAVALVVVLCSRVSAHPAPFSYLDIVFRDGGIRGTLVVHVIDVAHELGVQPADLLNRERGRGSARTTSAKSCVRGCCCDRATGFGPTG